MEKIGPHFPFTTARNQFEFAQKFDSSKLLLLPSPFESLFFEFSAALPNSNFYLSSFYLSLHIRILAIRVAMWHFNNSIWNFNIVKLEFHLNFTQTLVLKFRQGLHLTIYDFEWFLENQYEFVVTNQVITYY